ncbi:MAG: VPLPA-CTERM sorting domain-containing protein [Thermodesulfobacteriota bacterium]|nr:VPLPA-CTERM sorting domain-containing protein [Thermodesulfobacteriota bacterium]
MDLRRAYVVVIVSFMVFLFLTTGQAFGDLAKTDNFWIDSFFDISYADPPDIPLTGGGTGYAGGEWYRYAPDDTSGGWYGEDVPWWNQWFYDDPLVPTGKKVAFECSWDPSADFVFDITINWSNDQWTDESAPPMPGEDDYIERLPAITVRDDGSISQPGGVYPLLETSIPGYLATTEPFLLPIDYNPVWVSIDVRGYYYDEDNPLDPSIGPITGELQHECVVPIPAAIWLLGSGVIGLVGTRRRLNE